MPKALWKRQAPRGRGKGARRALRTRHGPSQRPSRRPSAYKPSERPSAQRSCMTGVSRKRQRPKQRPNERPSQSRQLPSARSPRAHTAHEAQLAQVQAAQELCCARWQERAEQEARDRRCHPRGPIICYAAGDNSAKPSCSGSLTRCHARVMPSAVRPAAQAHALS
jgi:hypothetical protein